MRLLKNEVDPRLVVTLDRTMKKVDKGVNGLMTFGARNDYPQLMERLINGSPTGKSTANIYAKFLSGAGFENEEINKIVIGKDPRGKNVTMIGMLRAVCQSVSKNNGFYIHCNFNNNIKIVNTHLKDFKTIRFSKPDDTGYTAKLLASLFWAESIYSKPKDVIEYNVFNINETAFVSMINEVGTIENFKGQIYFSFLDTEYFYPLSNYDEVYLDLDTENQIQLFKNRQLRNGFFKKTILRLQPQDNA